MQYKISVEELCTKLRPVFGKKMDDLYLRYSMADSLQAKEEIEHFLNVLYKKHLSELLDKKVLLEPPARELMDGDYNLALVSYAGKKLFPFSLREKDWMRHVCISGMSGSGKTTLAFHVVTNFIQKNKPFLIFDWKKSFRPLLLADPEILLFTVGNENISNYFKININEPPPGISPKEWINVLCDLITESFFASFGVHKILLETLDEAYRDFGVYNGSKNYPTWNEIKWRLDDKMEKKKGREASWLMSAMRIAHIMTFGNFGKCLNYKGKENLNVDDLLKKKVIFELNTLGTIEKKFFCEFILTYIYKFKKARQSGINDNFDHAIVVDEAHNIFLKEKTNFSNESVTDMIYREMREYGTSLVCLDQHISKISDTVSGNSACLIAFQQQLPQDIDAVSGLMQLRENKNYFSMLPVGSAIVKLSERYCLPFLIEVSNVELRSKDVSDYDVKGKMKFIFDSKAIESGKDEEFKKQITSVQPVKVYEDKIKEEKTEPARVPRHSLINGDVEKFRTAEYSRIGKDDSFKNLDKLTEVNRMVYVDTGKSSAFGSDFTSSKEMNKPGNLSSGISNEKQEEIEENELHKKSSFVETDDGKEDIDLIETTQVSRIFNAHEEGLNELQKILYEFVEKKLGMGWHINAIERMLEENTVEGNYSISDVFAVVDYALKSRLNKQEIGQRQEISRIEPEEKPEEEPVILPKLEEPKQAVIKRQNSPRPFVSEYVMPSFSFVTKPIENTKPVEKPIVTEATKPVIESKRPESVFMQKEEPVLFTQKPAVMSKPVEIVNVVEKQEVTEATKPVVILKPVSGPVISSINPLSVSKSVTTPEIQNNKVYKAEMPAENTGQKNSLALEIPEKQQISGKGNISQKSIPVSQISNKQESDDDEIDNDNSEWKFLEFLLRNPKHEFTTTELYSMLLLSARKGNKLKNKLMESGKIKIEEIKNAHGWKKIIRLK